MTRHLFGLLLLSLLALPATAQTPAEITERRAQLTAAHPDGLIILKANALEKGMEQPSWVQDASFQYFSGLPGVPGVVLVIDGPADEAVLFAGPAPQSFGMAIEPLNVIANPDLATAGAFDRVVPLQEFVPWIKARISAGVQILYLDEPRRPTPSGVPPGMRPVQGNHALWALSLENAFPNASFGSAAATIRGLRWHKSDSEVEKLRRNARASSAALLQGMKAVEAGLSQREAESAVVTGCLEHGADGPSFWPWMMAGPNAHIGRLVRSFFDNHNLNRTMLAGELLRADVGCAGEGYGGDVGRTVPVSGAFSEVQARVWDLLVVGYLAGIEAMGGGVALDDVRNASRSAIAEAASGSPELFEMATAMNRPDGVNWHIHGIGIESGEAAVDPLVAGSVIAYEPGFAWGADAYYLEDMILVMERGAEVLTTGLPYTSREMAATLRK